MFQHFFGRTIQFGGVTKFGCREWSGKLGGVQRWRSSVAWGCLGASQSFGLRRQASCPITCCQAQNRHTSELRSCWWERGGRGYAGVRPSSGTATAFFQAIEHFPTARPSHFAAAGTAALRQRRNSTSEFGIKVAIDLTSIWHIVFHHASVEGN